MNSTVYRYPVPTTTREVQQTRLVDLARRPVQAPGVPVHDVVAQRQQSSDDIARENAELLKEFARVEPDEEVVLT